MRIAEEYLRAVIHYWWLILAGWVLGIVDVVERIFGTWWLPPSRVKWTTGIGGLVIAQFLAYRDLRESTCKELDDLRDEVDRLMTPRYGVEHRKLAENKVWSLSDTAKDLLRFLLHHGRTEQERLRQQSQDHPDIFSRALAETEREGLIQPSEQQRVGRAGIDMYWQINPEWEAVLRDLLPAEQTTTHFVL